MEPKTLLRIVYRIAECCLQVFETCNEQWMREITAPERRIELVDGFQSKFYSTPCKRIEWLDKMLQDLTYTLPAIVAENILPAVDVSRPSLFEDKKWEEDEISTGMNE